jgi:hypothetical protein
MKIFVDTEFTDLWSPSLMSIGFAAQSDAHLYIEIIADPTGAAGWVPEQCSRFVRQVVIPLLEGGSAACSRQEAAERSLAWLEGFPEPIELVSDSAVDFHLLHELWGGSRRPYNLRVESLEKAPGRPSSAPSTPRDLRPHHALDDAIALRRQALAGTVGT